jgi:tRNA pseudouridine(55) synthase
MTNPNQRSGILLLDKPKGVSSAGVVARVKRILRADRVGHAGTLDPDATGLLIVLLNGATRAASHAALGIKRYSGEIVLGITTTSDDLSGEILSRSDDIPSFDRIEAAALELQGEIMQLPPKISAKKLNGRRAYKLFRGGEDFELTPRQVEVREFKLTPTPDASTVAYLTSVSPGTYVRSLARDLGAVLGCGGTVKSIRREASGHLSVVDSVSLDDISWDKVIDWGELLPHLPRVIFSSGIAKGLLNGQMRALREAWDEYQTREADVVLNRSSDLVLYSEKAGGESLGLLRLAEDSGFEFELNIGYRQD